MALGRKKVPHPCPRITEIDINTMHFHIIQAKTRRIQTTVIPTLVQRFS
jgi:hypothetical protein